MRFSEIAGETGIFVDGDWIEKKDQDAKGAVRLIQLADVGPGEFRDKSDRHITVEKADELHCTFLRKGDILIARLGDPLCKACVFPLDGLYITAVDVAILRIGSDVVNPKYLIYLLNSPWFKDQVKQYESGTTRKRISRKNLDRIEMIFPPLPEQERIVSRIEELFSQLDAGVETLKKTKAQLSVYRQAAITEAFSVENNTPNVCLSDIAQIIGGITKGRDLSGTETIELPYLRVANVQNGYLDLSEIKTIKLRVDEKERYLLKPGDVLYTEGGDRDKLGRGTVWRGEIKDCVHQNHVFKARVDQSKAIPEYVAFWSMSTPARNYFYQKGKQSVNLASINKTVLSALTLPLPALEKQREIINHIESRLSVCDSIEQTVDTALQQAEAMRQSILTQAFGGAL
ncbi:MAG: restriction endonuclease subunit S [Firmicutes bacterium]|nr:restriction endonuclease subunit S [Bacillota bacterium]